MPTRLRNRPKIINTRTFVLSLLYSSLQQYVLPKSTAFSFRASPISHHFRHHHRPYHLQKIVPNRLSSCAITRHTMTTPPTTTTTNSNSNNSPGNSNKSNNQVHWAIIGLGDVCTIKSGPAFYKSHGSTLSAVMRRTPGKAREWIDENIREGNFPEEVKENIRGFESVESLMEWAMRGGEDGGRGTIDAIYVATPPGAHLQVIRQIVSSVQNNGGGGENAGGHPIRAVYVEKPVGRCAWETRAIIDELSQRPGMEGIAFYPAYVSRAHERTQVLRNLLGKDKVCGDCVTSVEYVMKGSSFARGLDGEGLPWRLNAELSGGGLVMDMGCHVLDRIDYLLGTIVDVQSTVSRKGASIAGSSQEYPLVEDYVSMTARIGPSDWSVIPSEGANVKCIWDFVPPEDPSKKNERDEFVIRGPKGSLRMGGMGAGLPIEVLDVDGNVVKVIEFDPPKHSAQPLIQAVTNELRGIVNTSEDGSYELHRSPARADNAIRTSEVLDAILNSYYGGRHDEFWLRSESWPGLKG